MAKIISTRPIQNSFVTFNSNPEFCCAVRRFQDKKNVRHFINSLGEIFRKHGVNEKFGLLLNHRHFSLEENEILVETLRNDGQLSVALPWILNGESKVTPPSHLEDWKAYDLRVKSHVIPQSWRFTSTGELAAYEFLASETEYKEEPPASFISELFAALKSVGIEEMLGLRRLDDDRAGEAFEVTPEGKRMSLTTMGRQPEGLTNSQGITKVLWYFAGEEGVKELMDCNRCGSCGICWGKSITPSVTSV